MAEEDAATTVTDATDTADDWRGDYVEQLSKFKTPQDLGKSYVELEKAYSSKVKIPDPGDTEGLNKLYDRLGRPETPEKYTVEKVEGVEMDDGIVATLKSAAHKSGLSKNQFDNLMGSYVGAIKEANRKVQEESQAKLAETWTKLKGEWGEKTTTENIELAKRAIREAPELKDVITEDIVESDPVFVQFVSRLMRKGMDDTLVRGAEGEADADYKPAYPDSPQMYENDETEEGKKARAWFTRNKGYHYDH